MARADDILSLPVGLPPPADDGACEHLGGLIVPPVLLTSTSNGYVNLARASAAKSIIVFCYPRTGVPDREPPPGWDAIPGARGCTPETCGFRDRYQEFLALGVEVFGLSTQASDYQREMRARLRVPFDFLSDNQFEFTDGIRLPTFEVEGMRLLRRLTLLLRNGRIDQVFYPVFPPDTHSSEVLDWLRKSPR